MRGGPAARIRLAVLLLALPGALGAPCDGGGNQAWVALQPDATSVETFSRLTVEVLVRSPTPVYAFDLGLRWDPETLFLMRVDPHPDFDDDGALFTNPLFDQAAGTVSRVVDLRHGGEGAQGTYKVATAHFFSLGSAGPTSIAVTTGGLARADGSAPPLEVVPTEITIEP